MAPCIELLERLCKTSFCLRPYVSLLSSEGRPVLRRRLSTVTQLVENDKKDQVPKKDGPDFHSKPLTRNLQKEFTQLVNYRYMYPEFLPDSKLEYRNAVREKLERIDMLRRRRVLEVPEFYVGSILAVTASDKHAPGKVNRFVGICILRSEHGTRTNFTLRNHIDQQGVEICYDLYNPCILKIEVLRLEKRVDEQLLYLRDTDPEHSTFSFDMEAEHHPENTPVPVNPIKVKLRPPPWFARWELWHLNGVEPFELPMWRWTTKEKTDKPWLKWDLMKEYRQRIHEGDQIGIWQAVDTHHKEMKLIRKTDRRKHLKQKLLSNENK